MEKRKTGRITKDTQFFEGEVTLENITKDKKITHATILSKIASLNDPIGFAAPLKVYGSYICRRALIESAGDPLKEVEEETIIYTWTPLIINTRWPCGGQICCQMRRQRNSC